MDPSSAEPMPTVRPGDGYALATAAPLSLLCRSDWTGGRVFVLEQVLLAGSLSAAHTHAEQTQGAYVLEGEVTFWTEGQEETLGSGGFAVRPAGAMHSIWNATARPARLLEITSPAEKFERFVLEFDQLLRDGVSSPQELAALAASHGTVFDSAITEDLCQTHGVSIGGSAYAGDERGTETQNPKEES